MLRRDVIFGGALVLVGDIAPCACRGQSSSGQLGCYIDDQTLASKLGGSQTGWAFNIDSDPLSGGSGDKEFDRALARTLSRISDLYEVLPGFSFFHEDQGPNAFASPSQRLHRADGTVVFGQQLFSKLMGAVEHPAAGIAAVCAHEFGHILQYKKGLDRQLITADRRVKRLELHADFLAGYFAGRRRLDAPDFPAAVFANTQFWAGDNMLNRPDHHGTGPERGQAVVEGYKAAYQQKKSVPEAIQIGVNYVMAQPG